MSLNVNENGIIKEIAIDKSTVDKLGLSFTVKVLHTQAIRNAHKTVASLGITKVKLVDTIREYNSSGSSQDSYTRPKDTYLSDIEPQYISTLQEGDLPFYPPLPCNVSSHYIGYTGITGTRFLTEENFCLNFPFAGTTTYNSSLIYFKDYPNTATGTVAFSDWVVSTYIYIVFDTPQHYRIVAYAVRTSSKSEASALASHLYYGNDTYYSANNRYANGLLNNIGVEMGYTFEPELIDSHVYSNTDMLV